MPIKSTYPDVAVPDFDIPTFLLERHLRKELPFPETHPIYIDAYSDRKLSYREIVTTSRQFGAGLTNKWNWQKGDVLCIFSPNNLDFPLLAWGCHYALGIVSPANPAYQVDELAFQLTNSGAKGLAVHPDHVKIALAAAEKAKLPRNRILVTGEKSTQGLPSWSSLCSETLAPSTKGRISPKSDTAFIVYSSGTTGLPKGVMLSHANIVANIVQQYDVDGKNTVWSKDKSIAFLPFYHVYGLTCLIHLACFKGVPLVVMARFDLEKFCQLVQKYKVSMAYVVPPVVLQLGKNPVAEKYDLSSIRMMNSGAAPLTSDIVLQVEKKFGIPVKQGYGLSETSPTTHTQAWEDWKKYLGSVGRILPNMYAKIVDEQGNEVREGEDGEVWMKGPNIMQGYLKNADATKNAITEDGYFKSGDIGHIDKHGNFYITDRVKELIKYKGFQVAPAELEGLLLGHSEVSDAAVIGVYSGAVASELPRAYVVLQPNTKASRELAKNIDEFISKKVASHKRLRGGVHFRSEIPKSPSGKILRRTLKEEALKEQPSKAKL